MLLNAACLLIPPLAPPTGRCLAMNAGSVWSDLRSYRANEFKGAPSAEPESSKKNWKHGEFAAWTETQSSRLQEVLQPIVQSLRPPILRVSSDADEYIPGPGLALTVMWDKQGPFVVATDDSAILQARRRRQARATEAGLARAEFVERVEAVEADLYALMGVAPVPELALRSALDEARTIGIPARSPHLFRTAAALLELLERTFSCGKQPPRGLGQCALQHPASA